MSRRGGLQSVAVLLLLSGCSTEAPAPALPTFRDTFGERDCACVTAGDCATPEAFDGQSEDRRFECRWEDRAGRRAVCSYESRSKPAEASNSSWSDWSTSTVRLRHLGERGWCWYDRS